MTISDTQTGQTKTWRTIQMAVLLAAATIDITYVRLSPIRAMLFIFFVAVLTNIVKSMTQATDRKGAIGPIILCLGVLWLVVGRS